MKLELMAPAKDFSSLIESINCGADSVYLGLKKYNARYSATNFTEAELSKAIDYAHSRKKRIYLTLNTLIKESEFEEAICYANSAINLGIDAIIIQDFGLFNTLLNYGIPLIASTQTTICNSRGVLIATKIGFSRVVLARELNILEIEQIAKHTSGIELECFIHGGLCIGYSGQCYISCLFDNKAANRGVCTTPCWDYYTLYRNRTALKSGRLLKPKDMYAILYIPFLYHLGIRSFKIQGRTRSLDYLKDVVSIYSDYIKTFKQSGKATLSHDALNLLKKQSPRGLMKGNLEPFPNCNYVVESFCQPISRFDYSEKISSGTCEKANHITVCLRNLSALDTEMLFRQIERIYIPFDSFISENKEQILNLKKIAPVYLVFPTLMERYDITLYQLKDKIDEYQIDGLSLSNLGDLFFIGQVNCSISLESSFHVCNKAAIDYFKNMGINSISLPFELFPYEAMELSSYNQMTLERTVYGRPPLAQLKYCLLSSTTRVERRIISSSSGKMHLL